MEGETILLTIDPQDDFSIPTGSLFVKGADKDMTRLSKAVIKNKGRIDRIVCTKDAHRSLHIAHPVWWVDQSDKHPDPFTVISTQDVESGKWRAYNHGYQAKSLDYVKKLDATPNKYMLCIWPPHCLIGSKGFTIHSELFAAFQEWESQFAVVDFVTKGSNIFTEHYSAFKAEVFDPDDAEGTGPNMRMVEYLKDADRIYIAGEALSHCVRATVTDIADHFGDAYVKKFVLLEDACSSVGGFEKQGEEFIQKMIRRGMHVTTTDKFDKI